ncbi:MAG: M20/M25/M40 family metallo-hydrolase [Candidatus Binataceae bacterium]|jgi:acetylornithine deacetylase/succinyl-diaminopimelate desuccinylase-like protein
MDESVLAWCKRLVACRSVTGEGTRAITDLCARELLAPRGIKARLLPSVLEGEAHVNLIALIDGADGNAAPLVLNTHLDTVPPGDLALWTECGGDPFAPCVNNGRIYGLGAADTKLDFVAKVFALAETPKPRRTVYLVATFGEEHGLAGARELADASMLPRGGLAFVGEASHLQVITAHKGLIVFELAIRFEPEAEPRMAAAQRVFFAGQSAHSSTPLLGRNAIVIALESLLAKPEVRVATITGGDAVNKVPSRCEVVIANAGEGDLSDAAPLPAAGPAREALAFIPREALMMLSRFITQLRQFADSAGKPESDYAPPTLTCNPGIIRTADNMLTLEFELRPPPLMTLDQVRDGVGRIFADAARSSQTVKAALTERRGNPGFRSPLDSETVELAMGALAAASLPLDTGVKAGCTEAGVYAAAGLKPVVFGPGIATGVIHAPNEYNLLSDVDSAIRFSRELLHL